MGSGKSRISMYLNPMGRVEESYKMTVHHSVEGMTIRLCCRMSPHVNSSCLHLIRSNDYSTDSPARCVLVAQVGSYSGSR